LTAAGGSGYLCPVRLEWIPRDGGVFLDLADTGPAGAGLYLWVRPHAQEGFFRPCAVLVAGEEERELGDGVLGVEHAQDTIVKYAIQVLAARHGVAPDGRDAAADAPWSERVVSALWAVLERAPHTA
jgi:hypothetical protein